MQRAGLVPRSGLRIRIAVCAIALVIGLPLVLAAGPPKAKPAQTPPPAPAPVGTLDQIRATGTIHLGFRTDARPFAYRDASGNAAGYSVAVCQQVAEAIKAHLGLATLAVDWVPVTIDNRFTALQERKIDLLCGADTATLARRREVSFSIPIFPGGIGALIRSDAPLMLRDVLSGHQPPSQPVWRASAGQLLQAQTFAVVAGTTASQWLDRKLNDFQLTARITPVSAYDAGVQLLVDRQTNVFFGDRAILLDAAARNPMGRKLMLLDRLFTYEPLALVLRKGDEDLRLGVDTALSRLYASGQITLVYAKYFGQLDENTRAFLKWNTVPE